MALVVKNLPANAGDARDTGSIPGGEQGNSLQYSCLENPMNREAWWATYSPWGRKESEDRGAWWAIVHGVKERVRHD